MRELHPEADCFVAALLATTQKAGDRDDKERMSQRVPPITEGLPLSVTIQ